MRAIAILAFACFAFPVISQEVPNAQKQAQCRFSNGNVITITYLSDHMNAARLTTDEQVITVKGRNVPPGDYRIVPAKDHNTWFLKMRRTANGQSLGFLSLPLSVKQRGSRAERLDIAFDHTGGSCTMHWDSEDSKLILSLEFTEKNADLPVIP
jgi:hypothetical protein